MNLELTRIFVKVAQNGSFSRAAQLLNVPKSTISKAISKMERESGTKLILRTTRSLSLTEAGRQFYEQSLGPVQQLEEAQKSFLGGNGQLSGLIKITAPEDLGIHVISPCVAGLSAAHPGLSFELHYSDTVVDLVKDGYDLAVRIGRLSESSFKVKRAGEVILAMVASPKYLSARPKIGQPKDLEQVDCLTMRGQEFRRWHLQSAGATSQITVRAKISSNQMSSLLKLAVADGGVALVPLYLCEKELSEGTLIRVLPKWSSTGFPVSLVSPLGASTSSRLKITMDEILKSLRSKLES